MLATLFMINFICLCGAGIYLYYEDDKKTLLTERIAMGVLASSMILMMMIAYIAGAR